MACATLGCGKQPASSRAKFCRQCFLESARTNSLKRQSFRGGRGVVGNKGNITARGVVGNKGNTTTGQSKVNAVEKRKSFKGNTRTGQSKRSAGKRSGLKRRAARRHMKDGPLLSSKTGCRSAVDAGTYLGRGGGGRLRSKMLARQQRTSMPRRLVPPLRDPVWQDGQLLFDSKVEHEVLASPRAARAVDDKGRHAPGRISIVFMANIWTHDYWPPAWIRDNHKLLCQQQAESGVVPRRKKTAGAEAKVAAPVSTAPLARRG